MHRTTLKTAPELARVIRAAEQRALFGRFLGKGTVYIDG